MSGGKLKFPNYTLLGMSVKKAKLVRRISPLERIYGSFSGVVFAYGSTCGINLYQRGKYCESGVYSVLWYFAGGTLTLVAASLYGELASLAPTSGGAYSYCYATMGEIYAFLAGWLLVLAHSLKTMFYFSTLSSYVNENLFDGKFVIFNYKSLDLGFGGLFAAFLAAGVTSAVIRQSVIAVTTIVLVNIVSLVLAANIFFYETDINVNKSEPNINRTYHSFVRELTHIIEPYMGFQSAVYLGEETRDASRIIPHILKTGAILVTMTHTLYAFIHNVWGNKSCMLDVIILRKQSYIYSQMVAMGGICSLASSSFTSLIVLVRLMYTMSSDGLIFKVFSSVHHRTNNIVYSTFIMALILGVLQIFLKEELIYRLANFFLLFEFILVPICLLITRYRCETTQENPTSQKGWVIINSANNENNPTQISAVISNLYIIIIFLCLLIGVMLLSYLFFEPKKFYKWPTSIALLLVLVFTILLSRQPKNERVELEECTAGVPYVPVTVMALGLFLLSHHTSTYWLMALGWLAAGLVFYLAYSSKHSFEAGRAFPDDIDNRWDTIIFADIIPLRPSLQLEDLRHQNSEQKKRMVRFRLEEPSRYSLR